MFTLADYILHAIDRDYMSGVERDRVRIKAGLARRRCWPVMKWTRFDVGDRFFYMG